MHGSDGQMGIFDTRMNRILIGLALGAAIIGALYLGEWYSLLLFSLIVLVGQQEMSRLSQQMLRVESSTRAVIFITLGSLVFAYLSWLLLTQRPQVLSHQSFIFTLLLVATLYYLMRIMGLYTVTGVSYLKEMIDALVYVPLSMVLAYWICIRSGLWESSTLLGIFILIWASDSGAYYAGRTLGRRRLFPRVSPNKTWEGAIGGLLSAMIISVGLSQIFLVLSSSDWLMISVIVWAMGTLGDLIESHYKRLAGVKDSGTLLGDHGGVLDRFDAFLCAVPFAAAYLWLVDS